MTRRSRTLMLALALAAGGLTVLATGLLAQQTAPPISLPLRGPVPLDEIAPAPRMTPYRNTSQKEVRNYPEQPPVIPHTIEGYQVDLNGNKCLSCHARARTGESQAPMVSHHAFHGSRRPVPRLDLAAALLLHPMPRPAA